MRYSMKFLYVNIEEGERGKKIMKRDHVDKLKGRPIFVQKGMKIFAVKNREVLTLN